jgi:hypothetical protein
VHKPCFLFLRSNEVVKVQAPPTATATATATTARARQTDFVRKWTVSGSDAPEVNATYVEDGRTDGSVPSPAGCY